MRDIENRADLESLLRSFYSVVTTDELISHHFADLDLETHLPIITDFWEKVLFGKQVYFGDPFLVHKRLDQQNSLEESHFDRWVKVFHLSVDSGFEGTKADEAKQMARQIGQNLFRGLQNRK